MKCIEDEIPFELPDGWAWARIGTICIINPRNNIADDLEVSFIPMPMISEGYVNTHTYEVRTWNNVKSGFTHFAENDIGIAKITPCFENRKSVIFKKLVNGYGAGTTELHILRTLDGTISNEYLLWIAKMESFIQGGVQTFSGAVGQQRVGKDFFSQYLIPIPPHNEQIRIVNKINLIFNFVITMENEKSSLHETIKQAKSKILDLAIRGQLVPQNSDDEPASVLLERIRAEKEELIKQGKIKRDKKESIIFKGEDNSYYEKFFDGKSRCINNEIPFDLPDGWEYERLGNICTVARGGSPRPIEAFLTNDDNGLNWIKIGDTEQGGKYIYCTKEKIRPDGLTKTRYVKSGDFLLTNSMSFGRPYILKTEGCIHDGWLVIGNTEDAFEQDYLYYLLSSSTMYNSLSSLAVGSTVKNLKLDSVKSLLVPIPPLKEQQVIANQIELLFYTILPIEKSLS